MQPPNEIRYFVHKRVFGAAKGFVGGGFAGAAFGFARGGGRSGGGGQPTTVGMRSFAPRRQAPCPPGLQQDGRGGCGRGKPKPGVVGAVQRFLPGGASGFTPGGQPRFGSAAGGAYLPDVEMLDVRHCLPGDVLGRDGYCYARNVIANKDRAWPRGRRPLGTPGEMAALAKAASFGRRMETTVKRMQKIGVLKKPAKRIAHRPPLQITSAAQHHAGG